MAKRDLKQFTEQAALVAAVVYPLTAIPQAIKIFSEKNAQGLSLIAWLGFLLFELVFFAYGITHNLKPVIVTGILWTILYTAIIVGIIKYG